MGDPAPPPFEHTLQEGLSIPRVLFNPFRLPRRGEQIGQGRPVLVIPGLSTGDVSTTLLRRTLKVRGFDPAGWRLGLNIGASRSKMQRLESRVAQVHAETGEKVIVIGWSLGGLYARVLAHRVPQHVAMVITVASPFSGDRRANHGWRLYEAINDHSVDNPPFAENFSVKPPVPSVAIWSAVDGVVAPECSRGSSDEVDYAMRVDAPHFALGTSPDCIERVIEAIAVGDRIAAAVPEQPQN